MARRSNPIASNLRRTAAWALLSAIFWATLYPEVVHAAIYSFVDERGVMHFTNMPVGFKYKPHWMREMPNYSRHDLNAIAKPYEPFVRTASRRHGVPADLIRAVILVESSYNPKAVSRKGAQGLMQIMPRTAEELKVDNPFDPQENIHGGTSYLRRLMDRYHGNWELSLAAYNSGATTVDRYGGIPPIDETREYVRRVMHYYRRYQGTSL